MHREIEAKFLSIDFDDLREKLNSLNATRMFETRVYRRVMLDYPDHRFQKDNHSRRFRVRDEGDKVMLNFKQTNNTNYDDEYEVEVGDFEATIDLLEAVGFTIYSYQESRREAWKLDNCEVVLDEWPWVTPYIEIEGPNEAAIKLVAQKLGFNWSDARFGSVDVVYMSEYKKMVKNDLVDDIREVKFNAPIPQYFIERR